MAIAFDAVTDGYANSTSLTFAHTCTGSDRFLATGIKLYGSDDITLVSYGGIAMTHIGTVALLSEGNRAVLYGLTAPASGANNVVISRTSSNHIVATAASYTGVSQTGQPEASGTDADAANTTTPAATVVSADAWLFGVGVSAFIGVGFSAGSGTTLRRDNNELIEGIQAAFDSGGTVSTGSQSLSMIVMGGNDICGVVAALAPSGGSPPAGNNINLLRGKVRGGLLLGGKL